MPEYSLNQVAKRDLKAIAKWGDENHSIEQSNEYRDLLKKRFDFIAENPLFYPAIDHIQKGYRRSVCGVHSIYYRINDETVEIMRIIGRQDSTRH